VANSLTPLESEAAWRPVREQILSAGLPVEATNVLFPGEWRLIGPEADLAATRRYVETAVRRAAELGAQVMVFGSGRARSIPEGYPRQAAVAELQAALRLVGDVTAHHSVMIALEPLRQAETNLVHTVPDALEIVRPLQHPQVAVLADFYHFDEGAEPFDDILAAGNLLAHVHLADTGRLAPGTGQYDYPGFLARLRQIGYNQRLSVECRWVDWERESAQACAFLRRMVGES